MMIDSHCHFDLADFDPDRHECWQRARAAGVRAIVNPAITLSGWPRLHQLAASLPGLYPAYGLHPLYLAAHTLDAIPALDRWLSTHPAVAVGECGLDFFAGNGDEKAQWACFTEQLDLAVEHNLPVIVHARRAVEMVTRAVRARAQLRGVVHSFSGSRQQADRLLEHGFLLGFGGPITYPRARRLRRLAAELPLDALLVESDAPDQPGCAHRGERNEPSWLAEVVERLAALRGITVAEVAHATGDNAVRLFRLESAWEDSATTATTGVPGECPLDGPDGVPDDPSRNEPT